MCAHNSMATQCNQSQYPNHNFALSQVMAQPNSEDLEPTDTANTEPTTLQASCDHTFNPKCSHNLMETQCNQPQYLIPLNKICAHIPSASQNNLVSLSNSSASPYPPHPGEHVLKRSAAAIGKKDFPVKWFKFIHPSPKPRMTETPVQKPVHVVYSPIDSMNYQWTISLHDGYSPLNVLIPVKYIPASIPTLCNSKYTMFHFGVVSLSFTKEPQHDFTSLASPKGEMESPFSWNSFLKSPRSSTLCFGEPTLAKLNQEPTFAKINQVKLLCETESYIPKSLSIWYTQQHIGAAHQVSVFHSNLVTTPSSSIDLTSQLVPHKNPIQHIGKNGEHSYGENWHNITNNGENSNCNSNLAIATKIIYFFWIQSEYNLSCMLSKHWELLKIP